MTNLAALKDQIKNVARSRQEAQRMTDEKMAKLKAWEEENQLFLEALKEASKYREEQENLLRELTLAIYAETLEKKPAEGVGIREITKFQYDPKEAFQWGIKHSMALKLDVTAFEKICKADMPDFVEPYQELQATISQDLSEVLK